MELPPLFTSLLILIISFISSFVLCASVRGRKPCSEVPPAVLGEILGPAYNSRYMSVTEPQDVEEEDQGGMKRTTGVGSSFYVDDLYSKELGETPAWKMDHLVVKNGKKRVKRAGKQTRQWECTSRIRWHDLGPDYFPRYLRSVECVSTGCWYGMLRCQPRGFTLKLLKRKDRCSREAVPSDTAGLPPELRELWVWEERAVNFCCDCAI